MNTDKGLWLSIDEIARGLFDGTASVAAVDALLMRLVTVAYRKEGQVGRDGMLSYKILDTPDEGRAVLTVFPGRDFEREQFELSIVRKSVVGYQGPESDVTGTNIQIKFGFPSEGPGTIWAQSLVSIKQRDESVWSSCSTAGTIPIGGTLTTRDGYEILDSQHLRAFQQPDGKRMWEYSSGEARRSKLDEEDNLAALKELSNALKSRR